MSEGQAAGNGGKNSKKKVSAKGVTGNNNQPDSTTRRRVSREDEAKDRNDGKPHYVVWAAIKTGLAALVAVAGIWIVVVPQRANLRHVKFTTNALIPNQALQMSFVLHNYGQLDARINTMCVQFITVVTKWPDKPDIPGCIPYAAIIAAGQDHTFWGPVTGPIGQTVAMSETEVAKAQAGAMPAFFRGRVDYSDPYSTFLNPLGIFGEKSLYLCFEHIPGTDQWSGCGNRPNYVN